MKEIIRYEVNGVCFDCREDAENYEKMFENRSYILFDGKEVVSSIDNAICIFLPNEEATEQLFERAELECLDIDGIHKEETGLFYWDVDNCEYRYIDIDTAYAVSKFLEKFKI